MMPGEVATWYLQKMPCLQTPKTYRIWNMPAVINTFSHAGCLPNSLARAIRTQFDIIRASFQFDYGRCVWFITCAVNIFLARKANFTLNFQLIIHLVYEKEFSKGTLPYKLTNHFSNERAIFPREIFFSCITHWLCKQSLEEQLVCVFFCFENFLP